MEIFLENIKSYKIIDSEDQFVDFVQDIMVEPENGKILAFKLNTEDSFVLFIDVIRFDKNFFVIKKKEFLKKASDIQRIKDINKIGPLIKKKVYTEAKKYLGKIYNASFNTDNGYIKYLMLENSYLFLSFKKNQIPLENIIEIKKDFVLVKDLLISNKAKLLEYCS